MQALHQQDNDGGASMSRQFARDVSRDSTAHTISAVDLIMHLNTLAAPDQLFWDSRELKKQGVRFRCVPWSAWRRVSKRWDGWEFAA